MTAEERQETFDWNCPWCGAGLPHLMIDVSDIEGAYVRCQMCHNTGPEGDRDLDAVVAWTRRYRQRKGSGSLYVCPFCGEDDRCEIVDTGVICRRCEAWGLLGNSVEEGIANWNRRPSDGPDQAELED